MKMVTRGVDAIKVGILAQPRIAKYVGDFFPAQVEKVYTEMGGKPFPTKQASNEQQRLAELHGHALGVARVKP